MVGKGVLTSHDVITVSDETEADRQSDDGDLPEGDRSFGTDRLACRPSGVHGGPDAHGVSDVVGAVREGCRAGGDDLHERVQVLDFVGVFGSVRVHAVHAAAFRGSEDADLGAVDVVGHAVEGADDDLGWDAHEGGFEVVDFVDGAGSELVVVKGAHGPAQGSFLLSKLFVVLLASLGKKKAVGLARVLVQRGLDGVGGSVDVDCRDLLGVSVRERRLGLCIRAFDVAGVLYDSIVGDLGKLSIGWCWLLEQQRSLDDIPDVDGVILLDHLGVNEGDEEQGGDNEQSKTDTECYSRDIPSGLVSKTQSRRALVDDR